MIRAAFWEAVSVATICEVAALAIGLFAVWAIGGALA